MTVTTDYTVDTTASTITFTSSVDVNGGDMIGIFYIPDFFDDYANYLAAQKMVSTSVIDMPETSSESSGVGSINKQIETYEKLLKSKPYVASFRDHYEDIQIH
jgi:hypothetical protein